MLVDAQSLADDGWVGAKVGAPVAIADDGDGELARHVCELGGEKEAASFGLDAKNRKEIAGDELTPDAFGVIFTADAEGHRVSDGDTVEEFKAITEINEVGIGVGHRFAVGRHRFEHDKPAGVGNAGQRLKKDRIYPGKDRSAGADADCQGENGNGSKSWIAREHAQTESEILHER